MTDTFLTIIQNVAKRTNLPVPTSVTTPDAQVIQLVSLLNELGQDLVRRYRWQRMVSRATFTTIAQEDQGDINTLLGVSSLDLISRGSIWNGSLRRPMFGPLDDNTYQYFKNLLPAGPIYQYRIQNNRFLINPAPPAGQTINAILRTSAWVLDGDGVTKKDSFSTDIDTPLLDDKLLTVGLRALYKQEKGMAYAQDMQKFEEMAMTLAARDGTKPTLFLDAPSNSLTPGIFVPSGSWGVF